MNESDARELSNSFDKIAVALNRLADAQERIAAATEASSEVARSAMDKQFELINSLNEEKY